jgi:hypothetical protein
MTSYTPSVDLTIFPKANFYKTFGTRFDARTANGRIYGGQASSPTLVIADGQGANWVGSNVYEVGQTVEARTAAFTGGVEPVTYRYRFITKAVGSDIWVNGDWTNTTNAKNPIFYNITAPGQLKFQSQARDSSDPVVPVSSVAGVKDVTQTTIGTVTATIDGAPYDIAVGAPVTILSGDSVVLATSISGDASPSYTWTVKSGSASFTGTGSTVTALIDTVAPGSVQIQCDIIDANASDNPFSFRYAFLIGE